MTIKKEKKKPYINNNKLYGVMCTYVTARNQAEQAGKELPRIPDYVGECFMLICNKLSTKGNFVSYSFRDEMVSDAIENCVAAIDSFDPDKSKNPFAYFTQIAWYAFIRRISKEKKQTYIKHKNAENSDLFNELINDSSYPMYGRSSNELSDEVIRSFEEKLEKNKKPKKKGTKVV